MEGRGGAAVAGGVEDPDLFVGGLRPRPGYDREPLRQDHLKPPRLDDELSREIPPPYFDSRDLMLGRDPLHDPRDLMRGGPPRDPLHDPRDAFGRERDPLRPPAHDRDQRDPRDSFSEEDRPPRRGDPFLDPRDPDDPRVLDYAHRAPSDHDLRDLDGRLNGAEIRDPERDREYPGGRYPPPRPEFRDGAERDRAPRDRRERDKREGDRDRRDGDRDRRRDDRGSRRERSPGRDRDRDHRGDRDLREMEEASPPPGQVVAIDDLLATPGRFLRPPKLAIVLRGLPGSGKSTIAKMIKDREVFNGGSAPRILCLDDYFMVESEKLEVERDTGRKVKTKIMEYEYDEKLEERYRQSLVRSYKKQVDDGFFPFIVLDCINHKIAHFHEIITFSNNHGFEVYVGDVEGGEVSDCHQRSTHKRPLQHVQKLADEWEPTPRDMRRVDLTALAQDAQIPEVEMEDASSNTKVGSTSVSSLATAEVAVPKGLGGVAGLLSAFAGRNANIKNNNFPAITKSNGNGSPGKASPSGNQKNASPITVVSATVGGEKDEKEEGKQGDDNEKKDQKDEEEGASSSAAQKSTEEEDEDSSDAYKTFAHLVSSKWDTEGTSIEKLDKLDGVKAAKKRIGLQHQQITNKPQSIKDWLELSKDYDVRVSQPGKKRVRWADFEERKKQTSARERGFVLGQTDWQRMTDLSCGSNALVQVRYIEPRENAN